MHETAYMYMYICPYLTVATYYLQNSELERVSQREAEGRSREEQAMALAEGELNLHIAMLSFIYIVVCVSCLLLCDHTYLIRNAIRFESI